MTKAEEAMIHYKAAAFDEVVGLLRRCRKHVGTRFVELVLEPEFRYRDYKDHGVHQTTKEQEEAIEAEFKIEAIPVWEGVLRWDSSNPDPEEALLKLVHPRTVAQIKRDFGL